MVFHITALSENFETVWISFAAMTYIVSILGNGLKSCCVTWFDLPLDIVDTLGISRPSIYRWQAIFEQHGSVIRQPIAPKGSERIITRAVLTAVHTLFETDSDLYLDELVLWLAIEHNIAVSISTLHATLKTLDSPERYSTRLQLSVMKNCENNGGRCREVRTFFRMDCSSSV